MFEPHHTWLFEPVHGARYGFRIYSANILVPLPQLITFDSETQGTGSRSLPRFHKSQTESVIIILPRWPTLFTSTCKKRRQIHLLHLVLELLTARRLLFNPRLLSLRLPVVFWWFDLSAPGHSLVLLAAIAKQQKQSVGAPIEAAAAAIISVSERTCLGAFALYSSCKIQ